MTSFESALLAKVEYIFAAERQEEWLVLRDSLQDQALLDAPVDGFVMNMRAAYVQLLGGAMMRALGGPDVLMSDPMRIMDLYQTVSRAAEQKENSAQMRELKGTYNRAYGSSPTAGGAAMAREFSRLVTNGRMSSRAQAILVEHFTAVLMSMIDELTRASAESSGRTTAPPVGGSGCLLLLVALVVVTASCVCLIADSMW